VRWRDDKPLIVMEGTPGRRATGPPQKLRVYHTYDLDSLDPNRPVVSDRCYWQRYSMYKPYKDQIRQEWCRIRKPFVETDPEAVYIHCRRTDYVLPPGTDIRTCAQATSMEEFRLAMRQFPDARRVVVLTDNPRDPFMQEFHKLGLLWEVNGGTWDEEFLMLASARWVIISQSTYSWWAAFLGRGEKIVCPVLPGSHWHLGLGARWLERDRCVNLYVDDEPERWIWVTD
jgi:hypothetical protein